MVLLRNVCVKFKELEGGTDQKDFLLIQNPNFQI